MRHVHRPMPHLPQTDYSEAVAKAIAWLGDRYLLARPINADGARRAAWTWSEELGSARIAAPANEVTPG